MTVQRIMWVQCDNCGDSLMGETEDAHTAAQAREDARGFGFHSRPGGRDICSKCWDGGTR